MEAGREVEESVEAGSIGGVKEEEAGADVVEKGRYLEERTGFAPTTAQRSGACGGSVEEVRAARWGGPVRGPLVRGSKVLYTLGNYDAYYGYRHEDRYKQVCLTR